MAAAYDEQLTPDIDPPLIEPPPPATLLRRIFAHRRPPGTVVEAPLVPATRPEARPPTGDRRPPAGAAPGSGGGARGDAPRPGELLASAAPAGPAPPAAPATDQAPTRPARGLAGGPAGAPVAGHHAATRYCTTCGDRVATGTDGLHCALGHRLSPAHARRRRRLLFWRR